MKLPVARTRLLLVAAPDRATLLRRLDRLHERLVHGAGRMPATEAATPSAGPAANHSLCERLAIVGTPERMAESVAIARQRLTAFKRDRLSIRDRGIHFGRGSAPGRVVFLFPGEGAQRRDMLREAREFLPPLSAWFDALDEVSVAAGEAPPTRLVYPVSDDDFDSRRLFDIGYGGQLCTVANLALYEAIVALGIRPDAVLGHSNGEHAAAMVACMDVAAQRTRIAAWLRSASRAGIALGEPTVPERMLAVGALREDALEATLGPLLERQAGRLFIAMENCPLQKVVGGTAEAVADAARSLAAAGGLCGSLPFERAYHTPLFADWAGVLSAQYEDLPLAHARLPIYTCLTGRAMPADPAGIRVTMTQQWTEPVRLRTAVENLYADGFRCFVEIGPDDKLTAFVGDTLRGRPHLAVASASAQRDDLTQMQTLLAALYAHGVDLDRCAARRVGRGPVPPCESLPRHAQVAGREALRSAQRVLLADARASLARMARSFAQRRLPRDASGDALLYRPGPALFQRVKVTGRGGTAFVAPLTVAALPFLADHALGRRPSLPVVSFTTSIALAVAAARATAVGHEGSAPVTIEVRAIEARNWLALDDGRLELAFDLRPESNASRTIGGDGIRLASASDGMPTVTSRSLAVTLADARDRSPAFRADVVLQPRGADSAERDPRLAPVRGAPPRRWSAETFYRDYAFHGPSFRGLRQVTAVGAEGIEAEVVVTAVPGLGVTGGGVDPALLDCAGQLVALWLLEVERMPATVGVFPYAARRMWLAPPPRPGTLLRARGRVHLIDGVRTEADVEFIAEGRVLARVEGLAQRVLRLPAVIARRIFGGARAGGLYVDRSADRGRMREHDGGGSRQRQDRDQADERAAWRDALAAGGGIFARAVAPQVLSGPALAAWRENSDIDALVAALATREVGDG